jgi:site-specific DNA-methyltransferase (adenine-specific)
MVPYFQTEGCTLYHTDVLEADIPSCSIDLIVTSPPYNVGIEYNSYEDSKAVDEYLEFSRSWLVRCWEWLKPDGRICINVTLDTNISSAPFALGATITNLAIEVGYRYQSTVVWYKQNLQKRTAWGSWLSASAPYVMAPVEVIILLCKERWQKLSRGVSDITPEEFKAWTNGFWSFNPESRTRIGHPAPFPIELPKRCVKLFSYVGDTVLDPFAGSGTTLIAAHALKRNVIGLEIDANYCELAAKRFNRYLLSRQLALEFDFGDYPPEWENIDLISV